MTPDELKQARERLRKDQLDLEYWPPRDVIPFLDEIERLREVLAWYGDEKNYALSTCCDGGKRARQALGEK